MAKVPLRFIIILLRLWLRLLLRRKYTLGLTSNALDTNHPRTFDLTFGFFPVAHITGLDPPKLALPHIKRRRISPARSNIPSGFVSEHQTPRLTSNRWWAFWWSRRSLHRGDLCQPAGALRCAFPPNRSLTRGSHAKAVWLFRILADAPADLCGGFSVLARTLGPLDIRKEWLMVGDVVGSECRHLRFPISGRDFFVCWGSLGYLGGTLTLCLITWGLLVSLMYSLRFSSWYTSRRFTLHFVRTLEIKYVTWYC